jgi:hypothetical protein
MVVVVTPQVRKELRFTQSSTAAFIPHGKLWKKTFVYSEVA